MFDRFDICEAYYLYFNNYHSGQWSDNYRRLCRMRRFFRPRHNLRVETLSENGRDIYHRLESKGS